MLGGFGETHSWGSGSKGVAAMQHTSSRMGSIICGEGVGL